MTRFRMKVWAPAGVLLALGTTLACGQGERQEGAMTAADRVSAAEWDTLAARRVLFGHQSVGLNILTGMQALAAEAGVPLAIREGRATDGAPGLTQFKVGRNGDPSGKIDDFAAAVAAGADRPADIALMKLCYVDISPDTDVRRLADRYGAMLDRLAAEFPHTTFVAVTAPLTAVPPGLKTRVKRLLGRTPDGLAANARRAEFNALLRERFGPQGRLFDLARCESATAAPEQYQGRPVETLDPNLTSDGGHLNALGARRVAAQFVKFLAAEPVR
ncbi:MAG: SGNH/GDSL hydrolase family protein [Candidatus Krumholzibacteriia bacterium]